MSTLDFAALAAHATQRIDGRRAVVIGASLAGLLAARVLHDHFDEVIVLDRDALPEGNAHRKATPHTLHAHGLLARGRQVMEQLFPGITDEWVAQGARLGDLQSQLVFCAGHMRFAQAHSGVQGVAVGRTVIEGTVRRRVLALPRVRACTGVDARALQASADRSRITGVQVHNLAGGDPLHLNAALVVDASGRGSRLPMWLQTLGYDAPREQRVKVDIRYATVYLEREASHAPGMEAVLCAATPEHPRIGVMLAQEGQRWVATLGGYGNDAPPLDTAGFVERAQHMAGEIGSTVRAARFAGEPMGYRFAHSQRRRYEQLGRFPDGLLALGDSVCSFNPIYGQGMTVAACEVLALSDCLAQGEAALARRFFRRAARIVDVAWDTAVSADLAIDSVEGERTLAVRLINAYVARVFRAAQDDPAVGRAFLEVAHLLAQPQSLMRPAIVARVVRALWRHRRGGPLALPGSASAA